MFFEVVSALGILGIAVLFLNPGHLSMPMSVQSMLILGFIIAYLAFSAFIFRERYSDEREELHIFRAGRISYLVGVGVLVLGIIFQTLNHEVDSWMVIALCAMVFSKFISRIYSSYRQ